MTIQPKRSVPSAADNRMKQSGGTGEIRLDVFDNVGTLEHRHTGRLEAVFVNSVLLHELIEPNSSSTTVWMPLNEEKDPP